MQSGWFYIQQKCQVFQGATRNPFRKILFEKESRLATQEIPRLLWDPNFHNPVHNRNPF
jgi:hypothetical protein